MQVPCKSQGPAAVDLHSSGVDVRFDRCLFNVLQHTMIFKVSIYWLFPNPTSQDIQGTLAGGVGKNGLKTVTLCILWHSLSTSHRLEVHAQNPLFPNLRVKVDFHAGGALQILFHVCRGYPGYIQAMGNYPQQTRVLKGSRAIG